MSDTPTFQTKITREPLGEGHLEIHTKIHFGREVQKVFTLSSLCEALDMSQSTMEGRYQRGKLHYWKVDIQCGSGRPKRGFLYSQLQDVIDIIRTPRTSAKWTPNAESVVRGLRPAAAELVPSYDMRNPSAPLYTMQSMADHFGVSTTTVRNKLVASGLSRYLVALQSGIDGGRPRKAMPAARMGDVKLAVENNARFGNELDRLLVPVEQRREVADYASENTSVHYPPTGLQKFSESTLSPVAPRRPALPEVDMSWVDDLVAEVEALDPEVIRQEAAAAVVPDNDVNVPLPFNVINPPEPEDPHVVLRQMWDQHMRYLIGMENEPDAEDFELVVHALAMKPAEEKRFRNEVAAGRRSK